MPHRGLGIPSLSPHAQGRRGLPQQVYWMYLAEDGETLLNRFTVRKLGIVVARASEVFQRRAAPDRAYRM